MIPVRDDNPVRGAPVVVLCTMGLAALVFLWQVTLSPNAAESAVYSLGFIPVVFAGGADVPGAAVPPLLTIVTALFLHGSWPQLLGNVLFLWIFGDNVEDRLGHGRFVVFYLLCGAAAAIAQSLPDFRSATPIIGASGAISGVLGAYLVLYPRANVVVTLPLLFVLYRLRVPAIFVLGLWFIGQLAGSLAAEADAGLPFAAQAGGLLAGLVLIRPLLRERRVPRSQ